MNVQHAKQVSAGHSIELGESTWDPQGARSIRDRWTTNSGGFSPRSSSEVPIASLLPMLTFAANHDELIAAECAEIIAALADSIKRQHPERVNRVEVVCSFASRPCSSGRLYSPARLSRGRVFQFGAG